MAITINGTNGLTTDNGALKLDTDTLVVDDTNNRVGIGTASPRATFDVTNSTASDWGAIIEKTAGSGTPHGLFVSSGQNSASNFLIKAAVGNFSSSTDAFVVDGASMLKFDSGYGSAATAYGCRAWVNFNGTGTVAIRASGNVSSITDVGTGNYTVSLTTAIVDANYSVVACGVAVGSVNFQTPLVSAPSAGSFAIYASNGTAQTDTDTICAAAFR
jgi:hypothetical protein